MRTYNRPDPWTIVGVGLIVLIVGAVLGSELVAAAGLILIVAAIFFR